MSLPFLPILSSSESMRDGGVTTTTTPSPHPSFATPATSGNSGGSSSTTNNNRKRKHLEMTVSGKRDGKVIARLRKLLAEAESRGKRDRARADLLAERTSKRIQALEAALRIKEQELPVTKGFAESGQVHIDTKGTLVVASYETRIESMKNSYRAELKSKDAKIGSYKAKLKSLRGRYKSAKAKIGTFESDLAGLLQREEGFKARIQGIDTLAEDVDNLKGVVEHLKLKAASCGSDEENEDNKEWSKLDAHVPAQVQGADIEVAATTCTAKTTKIAVPQQDKWSDAEENAVNEAVDKLLLDFVAEITYDDAYAVLEQIKKDAPGVLIGNHGEKDTLYYKLRRRYCCPGQK